MKKLFLIISMLVLTNIMYANNLVTISTDSINKLTRSTTDKVLNAIDKYAEKLGTTADKLFDVMTEQAKVTAITDTIVIIFAIIAIIMLVFLLKYIFNPKNRIKIYDEYDCIKFIYMISLVFMSFIAIIFIIFSLCSINELLTCIYNPKYYAIKECLNLLSR